MGTHGEFERLVRSFLDRHPELQHEWRAVTDIAGGRTDLIIAPGQESEVFASLRDGQIVIGTRTETRDFEAFGRDISQADLAAEALRQLEAYVQGLLLPQRGGPRASAGELERDTAHEAPS